MKKGQKGFFWNLRNFINFRIWYIAYVASGIENIFKLLIDLMGGGLIFIRLTIDWRYLAPSILE